MLGSFHLKAVVSAIVFVVFASGACHAFPASPGERGKGLVQKRSNVVLVASKRQCNFRCRTLREECVDDAKRASQPDSKCWDDYAACRNGCQNGSRPPAVNQGPDTVVLSPTVVQVGKWAEGVTFDGTWLWVAESGQRTIARIDPQSGQVVERVRVGRLPVGMVSNGDGTISSLVHTDRLVWRQRGNRGGVFARLGTCPESIAITEENLWVLTLPQCSSESSQVVGIDLRSGRQVQSQILGEWGQAIVAHGNQVWVGHARAPAVTVVDQDSLGSWSLDVPGLSVWSMTSNGRNILAGGRVDQDNNAGVVVMFDPSSQQETHRLNVGARVAEITADQTHVVAVGENGTIWILSAATLELQRTINLSTGAFEPRGAILVGDSLVLSSSRFAGENGAVFLLRDWRPANARQPVTPTVDCSGIANTTDRAVCSNRVLSALDDQMNQELVVAIVNTTSEAVGGTLADAVALYKEQRQWLNQRDRCGADVNCLRSEYQARLKYFKEINQPE